VAVLAEIEIFHSRPVAPTRRVALGTRELPVEPGPGFGGVLLAGIVARFSADLDGDLYDELLVLMRQVERGQRIPQPRLRHRFQRDLVGLTKRRQRLIGEHESLRFEFDESGPAAPMVLGAVYAAGQLPASARTDVMELVRNAMRWQGPLGASFVTSILGRRAGSSWVVSSLADPVAWARVTLGLATEAIVERDVVQRQFRLLLREAHPDSGGDEDVAARRISELSEARRILLLG
jgi:hypothetical protein